MGVARITIKQARDLPNMESLGTLLNKNNLSDAFVKIFLDNGKEVAKTRIIDDCLSPIWNESFFILVPKQNESLHLHVFHNSTIGDQFIGQSQGKIPVGEKLDGYAIYFRRFDTTDGLTFKTRATKKRSEDKSVTRLNFSTGSRKPF